MISETAEQATTCCADKITHKHTNARHHQRFASSHASALKRPLLQLLMLLLLNQLALCAAQADKATALTFDSSNTCIACCCRHRCRRRRRRIQIVALNKREMERNCLKHVVSLCLKQWSIVVRTRDCDIDTHTHTYRETSNSAC